MTVRPPAEIGMKLDEVDTPALIVDLDAFERNMSSSPTGSAPAGCGCGRTPRRTNARSSR